MKDEDIAYIGKRPTWGDEEPFGIRRTDRRQHLYVIGKTGSGKTTMLRNLIIQDIHAGHGVGLIDPHGDLAHDLLDQIPSWRREDVVYFDPADRDFPIGFNLFDSVSEEDRPLVASGIVGIFKNIWRDSWGPRLEYILYATVAALLDCENTSLLGIPRMLSDAQYRSWVVKQIKDPMVKAFWVNEFDSYDRKFAQEAIAPIQNKVGQLVMSPAIRNILGQVRSKIDFRFMMDRKKIFIANLSKGRLGEDKANLLGAVLVTKFQLAAMSRATMPESERKDFLLSIDEFQNFSTDSFASILSEARKYRLCLTLSHQYMDQLRDEIRKAVFGNVGSIISFRVGPTDASFLEQEFGNGYAPGRFTELANHEVCAKLLIGGHYAAPFTATTLPPLSVNYGRREKIIRRSREKYAIRREVVEDKINRWIAR